MMWRSNASYTGSSYFSANGTAYMHTRVKRKSRSSGIFPSLSPMTVQMYGQTRIYFSWIRLVDLLLLLVYPQITFSPTGQLWGNPLYRWEVHTASGYAWWLSRITAVLQMVDIIRIDHFRGFAGYYEIPVDAPTAETGRWVPAPGNDFFTTVRNALGELPILAEDLGVITPDVVELRDSFELPGMRIFQFAFGDGPAYGFLPHHYPVQCVVYTGTHDNDTALGWYQRVGDEEKDFYHRYMDRDGSNVSWEMIRGAWSSVAVFALAPMQDFLELDNAARMNYPGNPSGNWTWRMPANALTEELKTRIKEINYLYSRDKQEAEE